MPAELVLTVTKFVENPSGTPPARPEDNCTLSDEITIVGATGGEWKSDPAGEVFICPPPDVTTIAVKQKDASKGPVLITFTLVSAGNEPALTPTRIVFKQQDFHRNPQRPKDDPDGSRNFRDQRVAGGKLTFANHWIHRGKSKNRNERNAPSWKFWIQVKAADGRMGWIDPTIENSEDM